uniref:Uncharacterized protein n=1 Tax=Pseudomonas aeruginosa TaxID=287 RepID=A0A5P9WAR8_PSEAI|nr:hypothetical protein pNK546KPC_0354 [Pseudomonas aeruginosa]
MPPKLVVGREDNGELARVRMKRAGGKFARLRIIGVHREMARLDGAGLGG